MARTTVADVLVDGLARAGAARVFAAPDAPTSLRAAVHRRALDVVEAPDATAAVVLAAVTGEVGEGPGALVAGVDDARGLVRGLAHAQRERLPLIAVTAEGADTRLLAPVVKASLVVEPASAGHWIAHAGQLAMGDPRGPVHVVVAADVAGEPALPVAASCRPAPLPPPEPARLDALGAAIAAATRPLLITGLECDVGDVRWIRAFAETLPAPVLATSRGRGALADPHPLALGSLVPGHAALARADLVILLGVDAGELPPAVVAAGTPVARIGRARWPGCGLAAEAVGDLALVIEELAPYVRARPAADWDVAELDRMKRAVISAANATPAARLVALAREATPAGTLAASDTPVLAAWQAVGPRETLTPLGPAPRGYAVLAALAAQLHHPDRRVVAFTRAAALVSGVSVLAQAVALGLPLVVVVLEALEPAIAARLERAGVPPIACPGEREFAVAFSHAYQSGRLSVISVDPGRPSP
ncbi:MAG TPA: thiamine pyrophosphate-binding protein [Methylomirabilota bacterium]|nr:thiamine pyrophosphate-binding protein [Methylomirabilota bacterium]